MKNKEKEKAIKLRKYGKSYSEIQKEVNVSKSTLSLWLRDIKISEKQKERLQKKQRDYRKLGVSKNKKLKKQRIIKITKEAKKESKKLIKDRLFLIGLMLYWAEGDNSNNHERVAFTNSDPEMIKIMMNWFLEICEIPKKDMRARIHMHEFENKEEVERYWSRVTNLPLNQFHKTYIKKSSLKHRKNKLYKGTCRILTSDRNLFRKIKGWKLGVLEILNTN